MKYRPDVIDKLLQHIRSGMNREDSCILAGIGRDTFYTWLREKPEFSDKVLSAEKECKQRNVVRVQNASRKDWRAAAWWLKHKHSEEFHDRSDLGIGGRKGAPPIQTTNVNVGVRPDALKNLDEKTLAGLAKLEQRRAAAEDPDPASDADPKD